jgi:hypothetical protein
MICNLIARERRRPVGGCQEQIPGGYHGGYRYNLAGTGIRHFFLTLVPVWYSKPSFIITPIFSHILVCDKQFLVTLHFSRNCKKEDA